MFQTTVLRSPVMVSETEFKLEYMSAGCNRAPHCLAWSQYVYSGADCGVQVYSAVWTRPGF